MSKYDKIVNNDKIFSTLDRVKSKISINPTTNTVIFPSNWDVELKNDMNILYYLSWIILGHVYFNGNENETRVTHNFSKELYDYCNYFLWFDNEKIKELLNDKNPIKKDFEKLINDKKEIIPKGLECLELEYMKYMYRTFNYRISGYREFNTKYEICLKILEKY